MTALGLGPDHLPEIDRAASEFAGDGRTTPSEAIVRSGLMGEAWAVALDSEGLKNLNSLVTFRATQKYRLEMVRTLAPFAPVVAGDEGWEKLLNQAQFRLLPEIDYFGGLPGFYSRCTVNLNATSLQMKTGLNQRVFDVPACGGFLLTDARRQLEELFEVGREAIAYGSAAELEDLTRYYLAHDGERRRVIEKGRARVLADHTYVHRLSRLVELMRRDHT
jgi:spore maturation protein CgeB